MGFRPEILDLALGEPAHEGRELVARGLEEALAGLAAPLGRLADGPVLREVDGVEADVCAVDLPAPAVARAGFGVVQVVLPDEFFGDVEDHARLGGVGVAALFVELLVEDVTHAVPPVPGWCEGDPVTPQRAGSPVQRARVATVAVHENGFPDSVFGGAGDGSGDVAFERLGVDVEGAVELAVVFADAHGDGREDDRVRAIQRAGQRLGDQEVGPQGERRAVLFGAAGRQQDDFCLLERLRGRRGGVC